MKKSLRKLTAFLVTVIMIIGILPAFTVSADTTAITTSANTIKGFVYAEQGTLCYSSAHAYSGERSLKIEAEDGKNTFVLLSKNYFKKDASYNFEYYMYIKSAGDVYTRINWDNTNGYNTKIYESDAWKTTGTNAITVEYVGAGSKGDGEWYRVTGTNINLTATPDSDEQGLFSFIGGAEAYVDDLKITCNTPGKFVPSNPSNDFEDFVEGTETFPASFDQFTKITNSDSSKVTDDYTIEYSSNAYGGTRSMYVNTMRYINENKDSGVWIGQSSDFGLDTSKSYRLEFYMYPVNFGATNAVWVSIAGDHRLYIQANNQNYIYGNNGTFTRIEAGAKAGWYKYTSDFKRASGTWDPQFIVNANGGAEFYMDDITITEEETGDVVTKIDFEKTYALPKNVLTTQVSTDKLSVSWRNPKSSEISKVALYDVTNDTLISDSFSTDSDAVINEEITEYTTESEESQIYRLDFTYDDGVTKSFVTGYTPGKSWSYKVGTWTMTASEPKAPDKMMADDKVYHTAAPSIRVFSNATTGNESKDSLIEINTTAKYDPAKKYRLSGWVKANNKGYLWARTFNNSGNDYRIYSPLAGTWDKANHTTDWIEFSIETKPASETNRVLQFNLRNVAEDMWLDDLELYELDDSGNTTGSNLIVGIGAIDAAARPDEVTAGNVTNYINASRVRWTAADSDAYVAVYDADLSSDVPVAYVPASMGYVDIENLKGGNTYSFILKAVNSEGRESESGVTVTAEPKPEDLIISDFSVNTSGTAANVSVNVKNNNMGDDFTAQLLVAVYKDGNILTDIKTTAVTSIAQTSASAAPVSLSQSITVPSGYTLKVYLWDSISSMKPLKPSISR